MDTTAQMSTAQPTTRRDTPLVDVPDELLEQVLVLYECGLCLRAYRTATAHAPLRSWKGAQARIVAGRLAASLGNRRLGNALFTLSWREAPDCLEARCFHNLSLAESRGFLKAWEFHRANTTVPAGATAEALAHWLATRALLLTRFRDFDGADQSLNKAEVLAPNEPWIRVVRSHALEAADDFVGALEAAQHALELRPWNRPAVLAAAEMLVNLNRDDEAIHLLKEASKRTESLAIEMHLAGLLVEMQCYEEAYARCRQAEAFAPIADRMTTRWLNCRLADSAYYLGRVDEAQELARKAGGELYEAFAKRLATPPTGARRTVLPVGFVRQHHVTCAPATLASLSQYWATRASAGDTGQSLGKHTDHLTIADAICYAGTPIHVQRKWAEANGWVMRQFTLDHDTAVALIDRQVPFALVTVDTSSAHEQAVIGYDMYRNTLVIRDPGSRTFSELEASKGLEHYRPHGPDAATFMPLEFAGLLDGITLPDEALQSARHRLLIALDEHRREDAAAELAAMEQQAPAHRLTLEARCALAAYDNDRDAHRAAVAKLRESYPKASSLLARHLGCMAEPHDRNERLEELGRICASAKCSPEFRAMYAEELRDDAREHTRAEQLVRHSLRVAPWSAPALSTLAGIYWSQQRLEEAFELYRFACCLDDKSVNMARSYFAASRHFKRVEDVLELLESRFRRFGHRSSQPAQTLFNAYNDLDRQGDALRVLDAALNKRPDDGDLLLFGARELSYCGKMERSRELLKAAEGKTSRSTWLATCAVLAMGEQEYAHALAYWRELIALDPLESQAHASIARILAYTESQEAAVEWLRDIARKHPYNWDFQRMLMEWLPARDHAAKEQVLRHLLQLNENDPWVRRELAVVLGRQDRLDEAFAEIEAARQLDPANTSYFAVFGQLCVRSGRKDDAREAFREAVRRDVDSEFAIDALVRVCESASQRAEAIRFVEQEMIRQVMFGDGLLLWADRAIQVLQPAEVLASLRAANEARPDLWHSWSALVNHLVDTGNFDDALIESIKASERFPLLPRVWADRARVYRARNDYAQEVATLERALQINPSWGYAVRELASAHQRNGHFDRALELLENAVRRQPNDPFNHGCLAEVLWQVGKRTEAIEHVHRAVRIEPNYDWAWSMLGTWSRGLGEPSILLIPARELVSNRPGQAHSWLNLAEALDDEKHWEECLEALDRAAQIDRTNVRPHDKRATMLARMGRFDEALEACSPAGWQGRLPETLRGRAAWITAFRGDLQTAIHQMEELTTEDPHYMWGWVMLYEWNEDIGNKEGSLQAAEALARETPMNPAVHERLGRALLATDRRHEGKQALRRALQLDPGDEAAAIALLDAELKDNNPKWACQVYDQLVVHAGELNPWVLSRGVAAAAAAQDWDQARKRLRKLCDLKALDQTAPLESACAAMEKSPVGRSSAPRVLDEAFTQQTPSTHLAITWANRKISDKQMRSVKKALRRFKRHDPVRLALMGQILESFKTPLDLALDCFVFWHRSELRSDSVAWANVGRAYLVTARGHSVGRWMRDWRKRTDVCPWMLLNLASGMRLAGKWKRATEVNRKALELPPDHTTMHHTMWLALDAGWRQDFTEAAEMMRHVNYAGLEDVAHFYADLANALMKVAHHPGPRAEQLRVASDLLDQARAARTPSGFTRLSLAAYWRTVMTIARTVGGVRAFAWWLRRHIC